MHASCNWVDLFWPVQFVCFEHDLSHQQMIDKTNNDVLGINTDRFFVLFTESDVS